MKRVFALAAMPAVAMIMFGCQGKQADAGKSAAAAEVLPGSASDAMIAYDTLKSQPPLAEPTARDGAADAGAQVRANVRKTGQKEASAPPSDVVAPADQASAGPNT